MATRKRWYKTHKHLNTSPDPSYVFKYGAFVSGYGQLAYYEDNLKTILQFQDIKKRINSTNSSSTNIQVLNTNGSQVSTYGFASTNRGRTMKIDSTRPSLLVDLNEVDVRDLRMGYSIKQLQRIELQRTISRNSNNRTQQNIQNVSGLPGFYGGSYSYSEGHTLSGIDDGQEYSQITDAQLKNLFSQNSDGYLCNLCEKQNPMNSQPFKAFNRARDHIESSHPTELNQLYQSLKSSGKLGGKGNKSQGKGNRNDDNTGLSEGLLSSDIRDDDKVGKGKSKKRKGEEAGSKTSKKTKVAKNSNSQTDSSALNSTISVNSVIPQDPLVLMSMVPCTTFEMHGFTFTSPQCYLANFQQMVINSLASFDLTSLTPEYETNIVAQLQTQINYYSGQYLYQYFSQQQQMMEDDDELDEEEEEDPNLFVCRVPGCGKSYKSKNSLASHKKNKHPT